jgi:polyhydroxyalkanoate synthesis regulator phasin
MERGRIRQLDNIDTSVLHIFSRDVLRRIKESEDTWEDMVPQQIAAVIKQQRLFGYTGTATESSTGQAQRELVLQH